MQKIMTDSERSEEKPPPPGTPIDDIGTAQTESQDVTQTASSCPAMEEYPHSVFPNSMIVYLTFLLGYLSLASSLTATIYFPIIDLLAERYHTSVQAINLTITLYVVLQRS
ncbi:hypothetical protein F4808DRAFT_461459 [Astrocystis sublimbata]|nr:hypothetical protein F4808DRAFT_461459 [Astrocystis sublimbata]